MEKTKKLEEKTHQPVIFVKLFQKQLCFSNVCLKVLLYSK